MKNFARLQTNLFHRFTPISLMQQLAGFLWAAFLWLFQVDFSIRAVSAGGKCWMETDWWKMLQ